MGCVRRNLVVLLPQAHECACIHARACVCVSLCLSVCPCACVCARARAHVRAHVCMGVYGWNGSVFPAADD